MNKKMLKAEMILYGDTNASLADALGITPQTFSAKLNGYKGADFTQHEIRAIMDRYNLSAEKIMVIFFVSKVS